MDTKEELVLMLADAIRARDGAASLLNNEMRTNDMLRDQFAQEARRTERKTVELEDMRSTLRNAISESECARYELESTSKEVVRLNLEAWKLRAARNDKVRGLTVLLADMKNGITADDDVEPEWLRMAVAGEKIPAIKAVRQMCEADSYSLLFAKNLVELVMALSNYWYVK